IDPRYRELDDEHGAVIRGEAFERALAAFCATRDAERLRLLATYGAQGLRRMLTGVYETLRSAGRELTLELGEQADVAERLAELRAAALALTTTNPEQLLDLTTLRAAGERAAGFEGARKRLEQAALDELAVRDKDLLQELLYL